MKKKLLFKHIAPIGMATVIAASIPSVSAFAEKKGELLIKSHLISETVVIKEDLTQADKENFILLEGKILTIQPSTNGYSSILISKTQDPFDGVSFIVDQDTFIADPKGNRLEVTELKVGDSVKSYYYKLQPMTLSLPPTTRGHILIVENDELEGFTDLSFFDENLVNTTNTLKLNINEETPIVNLAGEKKTPEDLTNQDLLVFYTFSTRSIPAQTTPQKIVIVTPEIVLEPETDFIEETIAQDHIIVDNMTLAPLRKIAEYLEYEVSWEQETKTIGLQKGNASFTFAIGDIQYGYNYSLGHFDLLPVVKDGATYVPQSFIERLLEIQDHQ